nr:KR domain-containing protein [Angustibacter aerolatus]
MRATVVAEPPPGAHGVVDLGALAPVDSPADARTVQRDLLRRARDAAPVRPGGLFVVVHDTGGDLGLRGAGDRAWLGGVADATRTLALEWPQATVRSIDCTLAGRTRQQVADALLAEPGRWGRHARLRAARRRTPTGAGAARRAPRRRRAPRPARTARTARTAAGGRGQRRRPRGHRRGGARPGPAAPPPVAAARPHRARRRTGRAGRRRRRARAWCAGWRPAPVPAGCASLAATARRVLAVREVRTTLDAVTEAGSPVRYADVDVRDPEAVAAAVDAARETWGPVTAVLHGAGVLADGPLAPASDAEPRRGARHQACSVSTRCWPPPATTRCGRWSRSRRWPRWWATRGRAPTPPRTARCSRCCAPSRPRARAAWCARWRGVRGAAAWCTATSSSGSTARACRCSTRTPRSTRCTPSLAAERADDDVVVALTADPPTDASSTSPLDVARVARPGAAEVLVSAATHPEPARPRGRRPAGAAAGPVARVAAGARG